MIACVLQGHRIFKRLLDKLRAEDILLSTGTVGMGCYIRHDMARDTNCQVVAATFAGLLVATEQEA